MEPCLVSFLPVLCLCHPSRCLQVAGDKGAGFSRTFLPRNEAIHSPLSLYISFRLGNPFHSPIECHPMPSLVRHAPRTGSTFTITLYVHCHDSKATLHCTTVENTYACIR